MFDNRNCFVNDGYIRLLRNQDAIDSYNKAWNMVEPRNRFFMTEGYGHNCFKSFALDPIFLVNELLRLGGQVSTLRKKLNDVRNSLLVDKEDDDLGCPTSSLETL